MLGKDTGSGTTSAVAQAHAFTPARSVWSWSGVLPIPFWFSVGDDLVRRRFNRAWQELTRHENYLNDHSWMEYVHPEDEPKLRELYRAAGDDRREFQTEYRLRDGNGAYRWLLETGRAVQGPDGFICFAGTCFDITERKEVERSLRLNEARFRMMYESHAVPLCYWHADGRVIDANDAYLQLTGFTRAELRAGVLHWDQLTTLKSLERDRQVLRELRAGRESAAFEMEYRLRDGRHLWVLVGASLAPNCTDQGVAFVLDITDRKNAEQRRQSRESFFTSVFDSLPGYVAVLDRMGFVVAINDALRQLQLETDGHHWLAGIGNNYLDACERAVEWGDLSANAPSGIRSVLAGTTDSFVLEYKTGSPNGERWFQMSVRPLRNAGTGAVIVHWDITERRQAEVEAHRLLQELSHVSRVTLLGELSASLAHELNQPLTAILSNAQTGREMLSDPKPDIAELRSIFEDIISDDQRAGEIIRRLRSLLKKGEPECQPLDLNQLIREVTELIGTNALVADTTISLDLDPDLPAVSADRVQIQQVVLNLMFNAVEAMKHGSPQRRLWVSTKWLEPETAFVSLEDTGPGIDPEDVARIFDPFTTTKKDGMGMGLSICRSIVSAHGGRIWVDSAAVGARFCFVLPIPGRKLS